MARTAHTQLGEAAVYLTRARQKVAGDAALSYGLKGRLYLSRSGWLLLSVPNALGRGAFQALNVPGAEMPITESTGQYNAHISVMRPEEIVTIGGPDKIVERGKEFGFTLGPVREVNPEGWDEMERCWFIQVASPELEKLRKSYGLSPLPKNNKYDFHITFAVRRKGVTRDIPVKMRRVEDIIHRPMQLFSDKYNRKTAATRGWEIKDSPIHGKGVFATREFEPAQEIAAGGSFNPQNVFVREELIKYINHSTRPNTVARMEDDTLILVADELITPGEELTLDYVDTYSVLGVDVVFEDGSTAADNEDVLQKQGTETCQCVDVKRNAPSSNEPIPRSPQHNKANSLKKLCDMLSPGEPSSSQKLAESNQGDAPKLYRERAEIFGLTPDNQVYGGVWDNDKSFAVPGGGIDPGEDVLAGARREFLEETGLELTNPRYADVPPITNDWSEAYRAKLPADRRHFHGGRTHYVLGDLLNTKIPEGSKLDQWSVTDKRPYALDEALRLMEGKQPMSPVHFEARKKLLQSLQQLAAAKRLR